MQLAPKFGKRFHKSNLETLTTEKCANTECSQLMTAPSKILMDNNNIPLLHIFKAFYQQCLIDNLSKKR